MIPKAEPILQYSENEFKLGKSSLLSQHEEINWMHGYDVNAALYLNCQTHDPGSGF